MWPNGATTVATAAEGPCQGNALIVRRGSCAATNVASSSAFSARAKRTTMMLMTDDGIHIAGDNGGGRLRPFTTGDERTRQLARHGVQAREANRAAKRAGSEAVNVAVAAVRAAHDRGELGPTARAAAIDLIGRVVVGEIPVRHATDAVVLIRVLVEISRLEDTASMSVVDT
jgi:hypothetical protein